MDRKAYQRNWRKQNREKVQQYRRNAAIRQAIREIENGNAVVTMKKVLVMERDERFTKED